MNNKIERMHELIKILNEASVSYYQKSISIMTDYEYDKLYDELVALEKETNMTLSNSPTINVEPEISSKLDTIEHPHPMLSLSKTKQVEELKEFLGNELGLLSWKLDGLTIVLTYNEGKLISGVTRGNGTIGEVVTENVKQFKNIPLSIPYEGKLILRGEAIIKYSDFKKMNEELENTETEYKNPRNLCSGSVRQLDSRITAKRNVNCIIFSLIEAEKNLSNSKEENYEWLKSLGFEVVEYFKVDKTNIQDTVNSFKEKVKTYDIPSDGLVLTYNDIKYGLSLGSTAKFPKHSIAFKWQDETAKTNLINVDWSPSRTGLINPVAIFNPVELEGTIVSRASLHNISILEGLKLGINDEIEVYKANMIIPQIANNITKSNNIEIPKICPVCGQNTRVKTNNHIKYLYCENEYCQAKLIKRLSHFVSRNAMNIDGISDAILTKLIDLSIITTYKDLFHLESFKDIIENEEGFGKKSYQNLINSINKAKKVKLANFIYALGIQEIGLSRAKLICKTFKNNIDKIKTLTENELSGIEGIGEIIAKLWVNTFQNEKFQNEFNDLLKEVTFIDKVGIDNLPLENKSFVITGSTNNFTNRDELIEFIENHGGKVLKAISNNVDYLINNDINSTSTKNKKAKDLGIDIINEETLINLTKDN